MINKKKPKIKKFIVPLNCPFCKTKTEPYYLAIDALKPYVSERAKIQPKDRTGLCSKHQRRIAMQIKRARFIGLISFVSGL